MKITKYQSKIEIVDDTETRKILVDLLENQHKKIASEWAISQALRILDVVGCEVDSIELIQRAITCNNRCNNQLINANELRAIGFEIHQFAKKQENKLMQVAFRAFGHAISTAHMKEHAVISSDYVIKVFNMMHHDSYDIVVKERNFQLEELKKMIE